MIDLVLDTEEHCFPIELSDPALRSVGKILPIFPEVEHQPGFDNIDHRRFAR